MWRAFEVVSQQVWCTLLLMWFCIFCRRGHKDPEEYWGKAMQHWGERKLPSLGSVVSELNFNHFDFFTIQMQVMWLFWWCGVRWSSCSQCGSQRVSWNRTSATTECWEDVRRPIPPQTWSHAFWKSFWMGQVLRTWHLFTRKRMARWRTCHPIKCYRSNVPTDKLMEWPC